MNKILLLAFLLPWLTAYSAYAEEVFALNVWLADGDRLSVVTLDGKRLQVPVSREHGEAVVDLTGKPRGCYVVSVKTASSVLLRFA